MRVVCQGHSTPSCGGHCSYREENPGPGKDGSESQSCGWGGGVRCKPGWVGSLNARFEQIWAAKPPKPDALWRAQFGHDSQGLSGQLGTREDSRRPGPDM